MARLILAALICMVPLGAFAKDWAIERVESRAWVRLDGSIEIREIRTYRFDGSYSRAEMDIAKQGFDRLHSIRVLENGVPYEESDSEEPGTFLVRDRNRSMEIHWRYAAEDEVKTFEIRYELDGAVVRGPEHAEWYWTFIGDTWDRSTENWSLEVRFEGGRSSIPVYTWAHGDTSNLRDLSGSDGMVAAETGSIHRRDGIRIRMVFPSNWVPRQEITEPEFTLAAAQADEASKQVAAAADAARVEAIASVFRELVWFLIAAPIVVWGWYFNRYGRKHDPLMHIPETGHTPPTPTPAAVISWFLGMRVVQSFALVATLLDLARRGYLTVETTTEKTRWTRKDQVHIAFTADPPDRSGLMPHETMMLDFIPGAITLEELFKRDRSASAKWYAAWGQTVAKDGNSFGWYDSFSRKGMYQSMWIHVALLIVSIFAGVIIGMWGLVAAIASGIGLLASTVIERRTPEGQTAYALWSAYHRGLKHGNAKELSAAPTGTHLVYAVAMGMAGKRLTQRLETLDADSTLDMWLIGPNFNPALFASQVSGMVASASAGVSSGSGASSGSSGGGGGGGAS